MTPLRAETATAATTSKTSGIPLPRSVRSSTTSLVHRADKESMPWWRSAVIYQVYPRSFKDTTGNGIGDLPGVSAQLSHLAKLGVDALWLSPFYPSPQADAGYDVSDYYNIDPIFGTLDDFDALVKKAHCQSLKVIVDIVPNHTSDEHPWFQSALADTPGGPHRQRYIFREGRGPEGDEPPNNWTSMFGGSAWERSTNADGTPGEWYLHLFDTKQPDLNWENPTVRSEFERVLRFWLDRDVDGFRVDVASGLIKARGLPDWTAPDSNADALSSTLAPMWDQDEVHEIYQSWRTILDSYPGDRVMVAEAWIPDSDRLVRYVRSDEYHQAFNFNYLVARWSAPELIEVITSTLVTHDSVGAPATWVLSNHDTVRHPSRLGLSDPGMTPNGIGVSDEQPDQERGLRRARAATALMLALPGSAYLFQGEELGLPEHTTIPDELRQDPTWHRSQNTERGRDGCRVPLPWVAQAPSFGFSPTGKSWLPQPNWTQYAADVQYGHRASTFEMYRSALRVRRDFHLGTGSLTWISPSSLAPEEPGPAEQSALAFLNRDVIVITNFGANPLPIRVEIDVLLCSGELPARADDSGFELPPDTTLWARLR